MSEPLLSVDELEVTFRTEDGAVRAVDRVSFGLERGEVVSIVGESGCGKSVTAMSLMGLTEGPNASVGGSVRLDGQELVGADGETLRAVRGDRMAMVFQNPMTSLNPVHRIGNQIVEQIRAHRDVGKREAMDRAVELLDAVGVPDAEERARSYPHEFSGGMRQRAMIAMALSLDPEILIADEPTTALDVTIQAQIIELLRKLNRERGLAVILITHDLGVVAEIADRVAVMYAGRIVETGSLDEVFYDPRHPYTWGLLGSVPRVGGERPRRLAQIEGQPPSLLNPPSGCRFRARCPHAFNMCESEPELIARGEPGDHLDRCWLEIAERPVLRELPSGQIGLGVPTS
ncbi:MAG: ABC transporter ATP-binding protein [Solirubrobacterales bacterium]|nr:ABC transporter ATP-binding protein [Solirubrobacterales bacterium]